MYLEGIGGNRNYTLAEHFFSNLTDPAFNTSYHLFGQGSSASTASAWKGTFPAVVTSSAKPAR